MSSPSRPWLMTSADGRSGSAASSRRITSSRWGPSGSAWRQTLPMVVLSPSRRTLSFPSSPREAAPVSRRGATRHQARKEFSAAASPPGASPERAIACRVGPYRNLQDPGSGQGNAHAPQDSAWAAHDTGLKGSNGRCPLSGASRVGQAAHRAAASQPAGKGVLKCSRNGEGEAPAAQAARSEHNRLARPRRGRDHDGNDRRPSTAAAAAAADQADPQHVAAGGVGVGTAARAVAAAVDPMNCRREIMGDMSAPFPPRTDAIRTSVRMGQPTTTGPIVPASEQSRGGRRNRTPGR